MIYKSFWMALFLSPISLRFSFGVHPHFIPPQ